MAGRLAGLYGYDHYDLTCDDGTVWSVGRRAPVRFDGTYEPTGPMPSLEEFEQAREQYRREQEQRLDRRADRLIDTHPDLQDLTDDTDRPDDRPDDTGHDV